MLIFYLLVVLLVLQSLVSLLEGFRYLAYVRDCLRAQLPEYRPRVALIAPCKGLDEAMSNYLQSLFDLDYPDYQIIFVVESASDQAAAEIERWQQRYPQRAARCLVAGSSQDCGQKVHNLLTALTAIADDVEALAFVDSDVCLPRHWLRDLIAPLTDPAVGATTGYRWFISNQRNIAGALRTVWNGSTATSLGGHRRNFAWGGSMAIRRDTFEAIGVRRYWQGTVSDDYGLTRAVQAANLYVKFVPSCLVASFGNCRFSELLEFTTRQIIITRIYSTNLWRLLLVSNLLYNLVLFGGLGLAIGRAVMVKDWLPLGSLGLIYLLGVGKGILRLRAVSLAMRDYQREILRDRWWLYFSAPLVSVIFLYNLLASLSTNRITWRGITYELLSNNQTVIADRES